MTWVKSKSPFANTCTLVAVFEYKKGKVPCLSSVTGFSSNLVSNLAEHTTLLFEPKISQFRRKCSLDCAVEARQFAYINIYILYIVVKPPIRRIHTISSYIKMVIKAVSIFPSHRV